MLFLKKNLFFSKKKERKKNFGTFKNTWNFFLKKFFTKFLPNTLQNAFCFCLKKNTHIYKQYLIYLMGNDHSTQRKLAKNMYSQIEDNT